MEQHWTPKVQAAGLFDAFCPDGAEASAHHAEAPTFPGLCCRNITLPVLELESQSEELISVIRQVILWEDFASICNIIFFFCNC